MAAYEELERARAEAAPICDWVLLQSLANVTYATGYEVPVPLGAGFELAFGPPVALFGTRDASSALIVVAGDHAAAQDATRVDAVVPFDGFDSFVPTDSARSYLQVIAQVLREAGLGTTPATLGVEGRSLPYAVGEMLRTEFGHLRLVEIGGALEQARRIKTAREIALLRRAAQVADVGHTALQRLVREAGRTEFSMWSELTRDMFEAVGRDFPITGELVTGPRSAVVRYPNGPRRRATERGDAALMDISGRVDGYWFDCTNTHVVAAEPSTEQRRYARASQRACEAAMDALRPGTVAADAFFAARRAFEDAGLPTAHYAGHQIGATVNELPRLVPYDDTPIEPGMVFSVEPGAYQGAGGTFGARSEKMVLVREDGPEILSTFEWGIA
jgi:Xaa-Pro aminopeptidase